MNSRNSHFNLAFKVLMLKKRIFTNGDGTFNMTRVIMIHLDSPIVTAADGKLMWINKYKCEIFIQFE